MLKYGMLWASIPFLLTAVARPDPPQRREPKPLLTLRGKHGPVTYLDYSPDGRLLATNGPGDAVVVWDAGTGKKLLTLGRANCGLFCYRFSFSPDGKRLAAPGRSAVKVWDTATGRLLLTLPGHEPGNPPRVAFSPDGRHLTSAAFPCPNTPGELRFLQSRTGAQAAALPAAQVCSWAFTTDGKRFALGSWYGEVTIWEVASMSKTLSLRGKGSKGEEDAVLGVAFSRDSRRLATVGGDGLVRLWALPSGKLRLTLKGHKGLVHRVRFSPDGRWLATTGLDVIFYRDGEGFQPEVIVWDITTGEKQPALPPGKGPRGGVIDVCFSPDGTRLATAHGDGTVKVWSVKDLLRR